ncbi:Mov34/MPN/PAD-1 family protein [Dokdonia pacifica]|uniref:Mov34/MPN/PAD-1 family protein n=1 Tax=Dokdonia pacifica TaxID=1627892 RepID=UPI0015C5FB93|nr:Mov34/MPN/PAD-1 family protein [Dokdonia pacifica]
MASKTAEAGGVLFGSPDDFVVQAFVYDEQAVVTASTYTLNAPFLNKKIDEMRQEGLDLVGIVHSHPIGIRNLSNPDITYFKSQLQNNFPDLDYFIVPIIQSAVDGEYDFIPYIIYKDGRVEQAELELLPNDYKSYIQRPPELLPPIPMEAEYVGGNTRQFTFKNYYLILWSTLLTGGLVFTLCTLWLIYQYMFHQYKLSHYGF